MVTFNYNFDIDKDYYVTIPSGTVTYLYCIYIYAIIMFDLFLF